MTKIRIYIGEDEVIKVLEAYLRSQFYPNAKHISGYIEEGSVSITVETEDDPNPSRPPMMEMDDDLNLVRSP